MPHIVRKFCPHSVATKTNERRPSRVRTLSMHFLNNDMFVEFESKRNNMYYYRDYITMRTRFITEKVLSLGLTTSIRRFSCCFQF